MTGLQARRDALTRAELSTAAIALFLERGFVETTMAEVARAAGVSRRTAYRHYANKEDLIFEHPRRWLERFDEVAASHTPGESTKDLCSRAMLEVARLISLNKNDVVAAYHVVAATPSLRGRYARSNRDWLELYTELLGADIAEDDPAATLRASVIAGALVGGTDRAAVYWVMHPEVSLEELTQEVLDAVDPLWGS